MDREQFYREWEKLPPEAQRQVADFVAFLRKRYASRQTRQKEAAVPLSEEPFIGIWRNRKEMEDASAWVRQLREQEWAGEHE